MTLTIESSGRFNVSYDYDNKPVFVIEPSKEKYIAESKEFPRSDEMTPSWLKQIVES